MNMYGNSEPELTNQQKAAILFIVLGPEYSSMLFKHMNEIGRASCRERV